MLKMTRTRKIERTTEMSCACPVVDMSLPWCFFTLMGILGDETLNIQTYKPHLEVSPVVLHHRTR